MAVMPPSPDKKTIAVAAAGAKFHLLHATQSRVVKGEDAVFVHPLHGSLPGAMLYMVCDGHSGVKAAQFVCRKYHGTLAQLLPDLGLPDFSSTTDLQQFAKELRHALCEAFIAIDNDWRTRNDTAGTTVTVMLVTGSLITVANVGDSAAILDTGCSLLELTRSHRIHTDPEERARLKAAGCTVASLGFHLQGPAADGEPGVGPLRIWPGGLCVSRSVGDTDAGPHIVPIPHVKQVLVPEHGCRVILASDGLWDTTAYGRAASLVRHRSPHLAASGLVEAASKDIRVVDDTSVIVVDVLPSPDQDFPMLARQLTGCADIGAAGLQRKKSGGQWLGLFECFRPEPEEPDAREAEGPGYLSLFADVDFLTEDPTAVPRLRRTTETAPPPKVKAMARPPSAQRRGTGAGTSGSGAWGTGPGVGSMRGPRPASASIGAVGLTLEPSRDSPMGLSWASKRVMQEEHSGALVRMLSPAIHRGPSGQISQIPAGSRDPSIHCGTTLSAYNGSVHGGMGGVDGSLHAGKAPGGSVHGGCQSGVGGGVNSLRIVPVCHDQYQDPEYQEVDFMPMPSDAQFSIGRAPHLLVKSTTSTTLTTLKGTSISA